MTELGPKEQSQTQRERLLAAVSEDKWLPIIQPAYDFTTVTSEKSEVLQRVSTILGRIAVASHVAYEECFRGKNNPLLKASHGQGRFQYLINTDNPNWYWLTYLKGTKKGRFSTPAELRCKKAKFLLIPNSSLDLPEKYFIHDLLNNQSDIIDGYFPCSGKHNFDSQQLDTVQKCITLNLNKDGIVYSVGNFYAETDKWILEDYNFENKNNNVRLRIFTGNNNHWDKYSRRVNHHYTLSPDGVMRGERDEEMNLPLTEKLITVFEQLPLYHTIR